MSKDLANSLVNVSPHRLKPTLSHFGLTQAHVARYLGRGELYVWHRLNGFKPFSPAEETAVAGLVKKAAAMTEVGNGQ